MLYHLAKFGWSDVCLVKRSVLTAGSSWHAAGGFHALNAEPNIAALQGYTINLLSEIEKESGQSVGLWAKQVGRMAGIELPVAPLKNHYLISDTIPELEKLDFEVP